MSISYAKRTSCSTCGVPSVRKPRRACPDCSMKVCADCKRKRYCCTWPREQWPKYAGLGLEFKRGDAVEHKNDHTQRGRVADVLPSGGLLVAWDRAGFGRTYVGVHEVTLQKPREKTS